MNKGNNIYIYLLIIGLLINSLPDIYNRNNR